MTAAVNGSPESHSPVTNSPGSPGLDDQSFEALREDILPRPEELRWQETPWRTTFWEAVQEAQSTDRPILLWAMNGHPLACT